MCLFYVYAIKVGQVRIETIKKCVCWKFNRLFVNWLHVTREHTRCFDVKFEFKSWKVTYDLLISTLIVCRCSLLSLYLLSMVQTSLQIQNEKRILSKLLHFIEVWSQHKTFLFDSGVTIGFAGVGWTIFCVHWSTSLFFFP